MIYLSRKGKKILEDNISINYFTLGQEVLTGKICLDENKSARFNGIDFNIKYRKEEFLRINVGEIYLQSSYLKKEQALKVLAKALSYIDGCKNIGKPDASYLIDKNGFYIPYYDWVWKNKEEYLRELKNNTMFDDANIEKLVIHYNENDIKKLQKNNRK